MADGEEAALAAVLDRLSALDVPWQPVAETACTVSYPPGEPPVQVLVDARSMDGFVDSLIAERGLTRDGAVADVCAELIELVETCPADRVIRLVRAEGGASWWERSGSHAPPTLPPGPLDWVARRED